MINEFKRLINLINRISDIEFTFGTLKMELWPLSLLP